MVRRTNNGRDRVSNEDTQGEIFSPTDGKQRLKFVNGKTPHFKPYEGDKNNG